MSVEQKINTFEQNECVVYVWHTLYVMFMLAKDSLRALKKTLFVPKISS